MVADVTLWQYIVVQWKAWLFIELPITVGLCGMLALGYWLIYGRKKSGRTIATGTIDITLRRKKSVGGSRATEGGNGNTL